ncbi:unnamed protein product [Fusarium graminearum]|uniref:Uncharacterized protein n=1 Tax=Gibberella zeae TaxID=5518 RepID=A0A9N8WYD8_GIBZA|nr:unnamed protein product [Fusarium graminearum]
MILPLSFSIVGHALLAAFCKAKNKGFVSSGKSSSWAPFRNSSARPEEAAIESEIRPDGKG